MTDLPKPDNPAALLREVRRHDFGAFLQRAWPHISGGELVDWNWHLDVIAFRLDQISRGASRRLIVNLPPRSAKSKTVSVIWVAFMLGRNPRTNFVCVSYSNELSGKLARDCLSIIQSDWYRELFPRTIISTKRSAAHDFETTMGGGRLATSIGGTLTGRGGDIIILDDVIKPEEAHSELARTHVNDWFRSTLASRLNNKTSGAIIAVMQRLHQYDLCGMLLETGKWVHLSLPAIAPVAEAIRLMRGRVYRRAAGEALQPSRESLATLFAQKAEMGSDAFESQYQQNPVPAVGNIIKAEWLMTYSAVDQFGGQTVQSWDTGIKAGDRNDPSVCITARVSGRSCIILDVWRGRLEFPDLRRKAIELAGQFQVTALLIEDKASGQQLIQTLRAEDSLTIPLPLARNPEQDKFSRLQGVSAMIEAGHLLIPVEAPWLAEFKSELLAFPNGRFDDQVDALSQLLAWVRSRWTEIETMIAGPEVIDLSVPFNRPKISRAEYLDAWGA